MRAGWGTCLLMGLGLSGSGCRAPVTFLRNGTPPPALTTAAAPTAISPTLIEPTYAALPKADANAAVKREAVTYRGLDEKTTQCLAAATSTLANFLDLENAKPSVLGTVQHKGTINAAGDDLLRETRKLAALDARNKSAAEAIDRYLQLADAAGRQQLFLAGVENFDKLRTEAPKLRSAGLPAPKDDELFVQRAKLLADLIGLDAGIALLNQDIASRLAVKLEPGEQFWPVGNFGLSPDAIDVDAAVKHAIAQRPDLMAIRTLHDRLSIETLPSVREAMQILTGYSGSAAAAMPPSIFAKLKLGGSDPAPSPWEKADLESRRQQLADLLKAKEAEAAAQVRTAAGQMASAASRVALLRTRAESLGDKLAQAKRENKIADILTYETDHLKARADVIAAAIEWHQWRVRLKAAQGLLISECLVDNMPKPSPPVTGVIPVRVSGPRFARSN